MCLTIKIPKPQPKLPFTVKDVEAKLLSLIKPRVAKKAITVYKRLHLKDGKYSSSQFKEHVYEIGKSYTEPDFLTSDIKNVAQDLFKRAVQSHQPNDHYGYGYGPIPPWMMEGMFKKRDKIQSVKKLFEVYGPDNFEINKGYHAWSKEPGTLSYGYEVTGKFQIPKGARYFEGLGDDWVSDKIKFVGPCEKETPPSGGSDYPPGNNLSTVSSTIHRSSKFKLWKR